MTSGSWMSSLGVLRDTWHVQSTVWRIWQQDILTRHIKVRETNWEGEEDIAKMRSRKSLLMFVILGNNNTCTRKIIHCQREQRINYDIYTNILGLHDITTLANGSNDLTRIEEPCLFSWRNRVWDTEASAGIQSQRELHTAWYADGNGHGCGNDNKQTKGQFKFQEQQFPISSLK